MKLVKCISPDAILLNLEVKDKTELFEKMAEAIAHSKAAKEGGLNASAILYGITQREEQGTTGIGNGLAFPHARFSGLNDVAIGIATLKETVPYATFDHAPVKTVCMVIVPAEKPTLALKVMSVISRLFGDKNIIEKLKDATCGNDVILMLKESELDLSVSITAADIMRPPILTLRPDMPLKEATWLMAQKRINFVPVLDEAGVIIGEISCLKLFKIGVPDFFSQLKSVSFICDFDPFEKYFFEEAHSRVGNVMGDDYCVMPPNSTIMEIVFQLAVKNYSKIYVAENKVLKGIIDQSTLMERIINV